MDISSLTPFTKQEERELLIWWISLFNRRKDLAAAALGISLRTFYHWEQKGCPRWAPYMLEQIRHGPCLLAPLWRGGMERTRWRGFLKAQDQQMVFRWDDEIR